MTTVQPFPSCVVVTVRPCSSVYDAAARAVPLERDDDEDEEDEAMDDARPDCDREAALAEPGPTEIWLRLENFVFADLISSPLLRMRVKRHVSDDPEDRGLPKTGMTAMAATTPSITAIARDINASPRPGRKARLPLKPRP